MNPFPLRKENLELADDDEVSPAARWVEDEAATLLLLPAGDDVVLDEDEAGPNVIPDPVDDDEGPFLWWITAGDERKRRERSI